MVYYLFMTCIQEQTPEAMPLVEQLRATRLPPPLRRREIRRLAGASLRQVADELGVSALTVSKWERGLVDPKPGHAIAYRRLLEQLEALIHEQELRVQE